MCVLWSLHRITFTVVSWRLAALRWVRTGGRDLPLVSSSRHLARLSGEYGATRQERHGNSPEISLAMLHRACRAKDAESPCAPRLSDSDAWFTSALKQGVSSPEDVLLLLLIGSSRLMEAVTSSRTLDQT